MTTSTIFLRNLVFFFFSFIWTGTLSVIPQIFFLTYHPQHKNTLLTAFLVIGTIFSITGILASQHKWFERIISLNSQKTLIIPFLVAVIITSFSLFLVSNLIFYFAIFMLMKFTSDYLYDYLDQYFVKITPQSQLKIHVQTNLVQQLLGAMIAPFYFAFFYENTWLNVGVIVVVGTLALSFVLKNMRTEEAFKQSEQYHKTVLQPRLETRDWFFLLYSLFVFTGVMLFLSLLIYFLNDYYQFENAKKAGSLLIGIMGVVAIVSVFMTSFFQQRVASFNEKRKKPKTKLLVPSIHFFIILSFLVTVILFYMKLSLSFYYILTLCLIMGMTYGLFLALTRNYASIVSVTFNKPHLLSVYNNLPNYAALIGFGIAVFISQLSYNFFYAILFLFMGLFMLSLSFLLLLTLNLNNQKMNE